MASYELKKKSNLNWTELEEEMSLNCDTDSYSKKKNGSKLWFWLVLQKKMGPNCDSDSYYKLSCQQKAQYIVSMTGHCGLIGHL